MPAGWPPAQNIRPDELADRRQGIDVRTLWVHATCEPLVSQDQRHDQSAIGCYRWAGKVHDINRGKLDVRADIPSGGC
jgi:hypothetical protein